MESNRYTSHNAFLAVLIILTVISIKMAFLHSSGLLMLLLITLPGILIVFYTDNRRDEAD